MTNSTDRRPAPSIQPSTRMIFAYKYGSLAIAMIGVGWGIVFASIGWWWLVAIDVAIVATGVVTYRLVTTGHLSIGILMCQASLVLIVVTIGLIVDAPDSIYPRVSHIYLLVVGALGYLNYQREKTVAQIAMITVCIVGYIVLSCSSASLPLGISMPEHVRNAGTWANATVATLLIAACAYAMRAELNWRNRFSRDLMTALWNGELSLAYQPQVGIDQRPVGAEALLRWHSAKHGEVSPSVFIPEAETAGLMVPIGTWVLEEGCRTLAAWASDPELARLTLSVNVSVEQVLDDEFVSEVGRALSQTGAPPHRLVLELTESVLVSDVDLVSAKLDALHDMGITISLDDFGTGYSSLSYLRRLPVQQIKIDRAFVQDAVKTARSASLMKNVVRMGRDLGLNVLAEGVETLEQHNLMAQAGCSEFQGYFHGRPMPLDVFQRQICSVAVDAEMQLRRSNG